VPFAPSDSAERHNPDESRSSIPTEIISEFGTPETEREWIVAECKLAIEHLKKVCGEPPPEMRLVIQWQEHELGEYPLIVLAWEDAMRGAPWEYLSKCEEALTAYEAGEEPPRWPVPSEDDSNDSAEGEDGEPELPPGASLADIYDGIHQLTEYVVKANLRNRRRPRLVD
jgi:hypothetical protein